MHKVIVIIFTLATILIVGYLTYLYRSTGVPFYRHNDVYQILNSDNNTDSVDLQKNYTEPFKKYSLIEDEDELNRSYVDPDIPTPLKDTVVLENGLRLR